MINETAATNNTTSAEGQAILADTSCGGAKGGSIVAGVTGALAGFALGVASAIAYAKTIGKKKREREIVEVMVRHGLIKEETEE